MFWLSFVGAPAGAIAGLLYWVAQRSSASFALPTPYQLFEDRQSRSLVKIGFFISLVSITFVGVRSHRMFSLLGCKGKRPHLCVKINDLTCLFCLVCLAAITILDCVAYCAVYIVFSLAYYIASLLFHILIDYGAAGANRVVDYSRATVGMAAVFGAFGAICPMSPNVAVRRLSTALLVASLLLIHIKYVHAGINLLGDGFIPALTKPIDGTKGTVVSQSGLL
jgi:hypothetical protein